MNIIKKEITLVIKCRFDICRLGIGFSPTESHLLWPKSLWPTTDCWSTNTGGICLSIIMDKLMIPFQIWSSCWHYVFHVAIECSPISSAGKKIEIFGISVENTSKWVQTSCTPVNIDCEFRCNTHEDEFNQLYTCQHGLWI